jgi:uncharacterized protein YacL
MYYVLQSSCNIRRVCLKCCRHGRIQSSVLRFRLQYSFFFVKKTTTEKQIMQRTVLVQSSGLIILLLLLVLVLLWLLSSSFFLSSSLIVIAITPFCSSITKTNTRTIFFRRIFPNNNNDYEIRC